MELTRLPRYLSRLLRTFTYDLHVLGTPPAFALSQDQTLQLKISPRRVHARRGFDSESFLRVSLSCDALHECKAPRKDAGKGFYSIPSLWTGKEPVSMRPDKSGLARHCSVVKEPPLFPLQKREEGKVLNGLRLCLRPTATQTMNSIRKTKWHVKLISTTVAPFLLSPVE